MISNAIKLTGEIVESQEMKDTLTEQTEQLRWLAVLMSTAEQQERSRVAEVLHDDLQQLLYSQLVQMEILQQHLVAGDLSACDNLVAGMTEMTEQALKVTRTLVAELHPPALQSDTLEDGLGWLTQHMEKAHHLQVRLAARDACHLGSRVVHTLLLRVVRELLFNVVKHAGVEQAQLTLSYENGHVLIRVEDQGKGFDPNVVLSPKSESGGMGLSSIARRLELIGGRLEINARPGSGVRVTVSVPANAANNADCPYLER